MHVTGLGGFTLDIEGYRNIRSSDVENGISKKAPESKKKKYLVKIKSPWPSKFRYIRKSFK